MRCLRHVEDVLVGTSGSLSWPLSDTQTMVNILRGPGNTLDAQFEVAPAINPQSIFEVPITKAVDFCVVAVRGTVDLVQQANLFNPPDGRMYLGVWGEYGSNLTPVVRTSPIAGKHDAWDAQGMGSLRQEAQALPPFMGYSSTTLLEAGAGNAATPQGFPISIDATGAYLVKAGDSFSIHTPVGLLRMGDLGVSSLRRLYLRFGFLNPTLLAFDPALDKFRFGQLTITCHFYEATYRGDGSN